MNTDDHGSTPDLTQYQVIFDDSSTFPETIVVQGCELRQTVEDDVVLLHVYDGYGELALIVPPRRLVAIVRDDLLDDGPEDDGGGDTPPEPDPDDTPSPDDNAAEPERLAPVIPLPSCPPDVAALLSRIDHPAGAAA